MFGHDIAAVNGRVKRDRLHANPRMVKLGHMLRYLVEIQRHQSAPLTLSRTMPTVPPV